MDEELDLEEYEAEQRSQRGLSQIIPDQELEKTNAFQEQIENLQVSIMDFTEMVESKLGQVNA